MCLKFVFHQSLKALRWSTPSSDIISAEPKAHIVQKTNAVSSLNWSSATPATITPSSMQRRLLTSAISSIGTTALARSCRKCRVCGTYFSKSSVKAWKIYFNLWWHLKYSSHHLALSGINLIRSWLNPGGYDWVPHTSLIRAYINNPSTTNRSRGSKPKISDLKDHPHMQFQRNAFIGGQRKHLVVVHDLLKCQFRTSLHTARTQVKLAEFMDSIQLASRSPSKQKLIQLNESRSLGGRRIGVRYVTHHQAQS